MQFNTPLRMRADTGPEGASRPRGSISPAAPGDRRGDILRHDALLRLEAAQGVSCVVLQGPAGSGKSHFLRTWAAGKTAAGATLIWLDCHFLPHGDIAASLVRECLRFLPGLDKGLSATQERGPDQDVPLILGLIRALSHHPGSLVFVFDNLHALEDPARLQCLQALLDYCPAHLQCLFAHRTPLPLSLARLRDRGALLQIDPPSFVWNLDETRNFIRNRLGVHAYSRVQAWSDLTQGWCTGLVYLCDAYDNSKNTEVEKPAHGVPDGLLDYLDCEVLQHLCDDDIHCLTVLAQLSPGHEALLPLVLDTDASVVMRRLARLSQCTGFLFVQKSSAASPYWSLHPILRLALQRRFATWEPDAKTQFHQRASAAFISIPDFRSVVHHAICAGMSDPLGLMEQCVKEMGQRGDLSEIAQVLSLLPAQASGARPALRSWLAMIALTTHRFDDCRRLLNESAACRRHLPVTERYRWYVIEGMLAIYSDDIDTAAGLVPVLEEMPQNQVDAVTRAGQRNVLSWIYIHQSAYERARKVQLNASATEGSTLNETMFGQQIGRCMIGFSLALEGKMNEAERIYRDVLAECSSHEDKYIDAICQASGLLGETLYELNDLDSVLGLSTRLVEMERVAIPDTFLRVKLGMGRALALRGRLRESAEVLKRLEQYARARNLRRILSYSLLEQCSLSLQDHDRTTAERFRCELAELRHREESRSQGNAGDVAAVAYRADILCSIHLGATEAARRKILYLMQRSEDAGRYRRVAALHCQLAVIERRLGNQAAVTSSMKKALGIGYRLGLLRSLLDAHPEVPDLAHDFLAMGGADSTTAFQADLLCSAFGISPLVGPATHGRDHEVILRPNKPLADESLLTERELDIAHQLILAMPNKLIARALNLSPETVKWHLSNIYQKLRVTNRHDAITRLRKFLRAS